MVLGEFRQHNVKDLVRCTLGGVFLCSAHAPLTIGARRLALAFARLAAIANFSGCRSSRDSLDDQFQKQVRAMNERAKALA